MKGENDINLQKPDVSFSGDFVDADGNVKSGKVSLNNSLEIGASGKIGPVEGEGSVNLYQLAKAAKNYVTAAADYVAGKISEIWTW
ncbi:hypothetical protein I5907_07550 [Panacibacter sp. DH6]|uniref:Uncharacterized protein n=1 Tax=Panacibacter microcysteis TaxID=2793269 RepID=A0A931E2W8_9BACT|nr:hypothetical protein [Panacibacter microcysteis]MBG9376083.1 hypothetical protein [Panacibacter microcysteis]